MENMEIFNAVRSVPQEAQRSFNNGRFKGTDISPMWRIEILTKMFGPAGIGWYVDNVTERCEGHGDMVMAIVNLELHVKVDGEWSKPIYGTGGNVLLSSKGNASDEGYKMAYTDALSVACKALGIGADVYYGRPDSKYTVEAPKEDPKPDMHFRCADCGKVLEPYTKSNGETVSVRSIAERSKAKFGVMLCTECGKKRANESQNN